ncbi:MAG: adenylate/guanylate cyclase domain-containing protein [Candidatus Tectomicrobia bacterium]
MRNYRRYLSLFVFGGMGLVLFTLLAFTTVSNAIRDKALIVQNAQTQAYWMARSLEIGHSMMMRNHINALRDIITAIEQKPEVHSLIVLDASQRVLVATDAKLEGSLWPDNLGDPAETGSILKSDPGTMRLVFPAFFARDSQRLQLHHPDVHSAVNSARWIIIELDASQAQAHYRSIIMQSVFLSIGFVIVGLGAFLFFGMIQRYQLANASIERLEHIKQHLARFVPGTVKKLIEDNPEHPSLDKVERDATVLFLDIDHYTKISQDMLPEALNHLIEHYFSAFLDTILAHSGEINETAGDGIMAIFTGKSRHTHAVNAVKAAVRIREQTNALTRDKAREEPDIHVNIGISTGPVLLGATMIKGAVGERLTYTASGMVTNVAARLCEFGTEGEIHLSEVTASEIMDQFKLHRMLQVHLKNIQNPVPVYRIV